MPDTATVSATAESPEMSEPSAQDLLEADLLVEDVSIDGMCGVY